MTRGWSEKRWETIHVKTAPPAAPAAPPRPTTVLTLVEGNISVGVEKRFADHPWCAAVARQKSAIAGQALCGEITRIWGTSMMGRTQRAQTSKANFRPELTLWPRF